jgi:hypothetical protein
MAFAQTRVQMGAAQGLAIRSAPIVQRLPLRNLILTGQRRIDEVRKTARVLFRETHVLVSETTLGKRFDAQIMNRGLFGDKPPEGIFRNLPEQRYVKSIVALRTANGKILDANTKKLNENSEALTVQMGIFNRYSCYALR